MRFEPDLHLYEEALVNAYDLMLRSVSAVPRVETLLYPEEVRQKGHEKSSQDISLFYIFILFARFSFCRLVNHFLCAKVSRMLMLIIDLLRLGRFCCYNEKG